MDNYLTQLSQFFLEPVKREKGRPGGFRVLGDMKNTMFKPHTQQNEISKVIPSTRKSQSTQNTVVNQQKQSACPSSTSPNSTCSDSVKSLILKLNAAKQRQGKTRRKTVPPNVPQNRIPTVSESTVSVQSTSILEQMFMSNKKPVLYQNVKSRKSSVEAPRVASKSAITTPNIVASSSIAQVPLSNSGKPALAESQPPRPVASRQRSVGEPCVTPQIAITGSSRVASSYLEEWFLFGSGGPLQPLPSRRRSAEEVRCTPQVPGIASSVAEPSGGVTRHHIQSANNLSKSLQIVGSEAPTSKPYCEETLSPDLTIQRLGTVNNKAGPPNHQFIEQGRSGHQLLPRANNDKSPYQYKSRKHGGKEKSHSEDSHPVDTESDSEGDQPPPKSKRIPSVSARIIAESTKEFIGDNLQPKENVKQTEKAKSKAVSKQSSKSSFLSKKHVLNNHSRSTQKTKQSRKTGLEDIVVRSRKSSGKHSQHDVDQILQSAKKKTTIHTASKKNSNSHSQRGIIEYMKKGTSKKSVGCKRAASSKDFHSQSRKRIRKSLIKSDNVASDEDDSGLQKSHSSGGSIFTLSELEHACNMLVPFSEIQQLEERLHHGPVTTSRHITGSHSGLGSIFEARIHPGGIWKSIVDEG